MEKLNLPVLKVSPPPASKMTMDRYVKFVRMYVRYIMNRKNYEEKQNRSVVNVPFKLK